MDQPELPEQYEDHRVLIRKRPPRRECRGGFALSVMFFLIGFAVRTAIKIAVGTIAVALARADFEPIEVLRIEDPRLCFRREPLLSALLRRVFRAALGEFFRTAISIRLAFGEFFRTAIAIGLALGISISVFAAIGEISAAIAVGLALGEFGVSVSAIGIRGTD